MFDSTLDTMDFYLILIIFITVAYAGGLQTEDPLS